MPSRVRSQLALDEKMVEDDALLSALEERERRKASLAAVRAEFKTAHEAASVEIERLNLGDDTAVRVGRFRVSRSSVVARSVAFETEPTSRLQITLLD